MNAIAGPLQGFGPFLRKELSAWWRGRGALVVLVVLTALGALGTLATRIDELAGGTPTAAELDPTMNLIGAQFDQWIVFGSIFASMGMLIAERGSGTLAWTLSKPMSRTALLLAKWVAGTSVLIVFGLVLPLATSAIIATLAYGSVPDLSRVALLVLVLAAAPAFIVALNLALSTLVNSQPAIAAIGFGVALAPYLAASLAPVAAELWPTSMARLATAMAAGEPTNLPTVASWAAAMVVVAGAGLLVFKREEL
ncbi:MAG TPA: ABC transporter permease subunit [Candidatus Limnocylindria bacterium]